MLDVKGDKSLWEKKHLEGVGNVLLVEESYYDSIVEMIAKKEEYGKMLMDSVRYAQESASIRLSQNVDLQKEIEQLKKQAEGYRSNWIKSSDKTIELKKEVERLQQEIEWLKSGLREIADPDISAFVAWQDKNEELGNDLNEWDWFAALARQALNNK